MSCDVGETGTAFSCVHLQLWCRCRGRGSSPQNPTKQCCALHSSGGSQAHRLSRNSESLHPRLHREGLCSFYSDSLGSLPKLPCCYPVTQFSLSFSFLFYLQAPSCLRFHIGKGPNRSKGPVTCQCTLEESKDLPQ